MLAASSSCALLRLRPTHAPTAAPTTRREGQQAAAAGSSDETRILRLQFNHALRNKKRRVVKWVGGCEGLFGSACIGVGGSEAAGGFGWRGVGLGVCWGGGLRERAEESCWWKRRRRMSESAARAGSPERSACPRMHVPSCLCVCGQEVPTPFHTPPTHPHRHKQSTTHVQQQQQQQQQRRPCAFVLRQLYTP